LLEEYPSKHKKLLDEGKREEARLLEEQWKRDKDKFDSLKSDVMLELLGFIDPETGEQKAPSHEQLEFIKKIKEVGQ
jgi:hypothetical protein